MKIKQLSELCDKDSFLIYGSSDHISDGEAKKIFFDCLSSQKSTNFFVVFCNSERTAVRYLYQENNTVHIGRKYFPPGKLLWPSSESEMIRLSREKQDQIYTCLLCPVIEEADGKCDH